LAVTCALTGGADARIVHALAGDKVNWGKYDRRPDEGFLEQTYRRIEPHLSL
jgi:hypothetical protein